MLPEAWQPQSPGAIQRFHPFQGSGHGLHPLFEDLLHSGLLRTTHHVGSGTDGRGFLSSDGLQGGSKVLAMVEANGGHGDQGPAWVGGGGIQATAQPSLQHQPVGLLLIEMHQCGADQLFEGRQTTVFDHGLQGFQDAAQGFNPDQGVVNPDAFAPAHEMG